MTEQLKPCPFCGSEAKLKTITDDPEGPNYQGNYIACEACGSSTQLMFSAGEDCRPVLAQLWNTRALTQRPAAQTEREAFERWATNDGAWPDNIGKVAAWDAWQARASLPTKPAEQATPEPLHLFEFWWESHMPQATQSQAWAAWTAAQNSKGATIDAAQATQQAAGEPVGDGFVAFKAKCDEVFGWVVGLGGYEDAVREAWKAAHPAPGVPEDVRTALEFYAGGNHFVRADADAWETVSGEPPNFWEDEANTATVEDGTIARNALAMLAAAQAKGGE